jgi:Flp pilus assembly protein TadD/4-amino-4-deoxy-L-arabinose transferase-like glycosyltransferase
MSRRLTIALVVAFAAGIAIRVWNASLFPLMRGYDAFAHFGYIWFLAAEGRLPEATAGWQFFQPPAFYVYALAFWQGLESVDPMTRLRLATAGVAAATAVPAWVAMRAASRTLGSRAAGAAAAAFVLFLPVHLYSAGFLGNEAFCAVLSSVVLALALRVLERPTLARCAALGIVAGLALLSKFTAVVVAAAALGALALDALRRRDIAAGSLRIGVAAAAMLVVCGWFYGRNIVEYGNPFQMSREKLFLSHVENSQLQGRRTFAEYVLFDPLILYRPQWPRGLSLDGTRPDGSEPSALRESVPTGLYANTWFDGFGGFVLPRVTESELSRRAGQVLLTLGLVPTLLVLAGFVSGIRRLTRDGWDDGIVVMLLATVAMAAVVVQGTRAVPTHAAVKATYLLPVSVAFGFWFALGLAALARRAPAAARGAGAACALLAVVSAAVFTHGLLFREWSASARAGDAPTQNLYGMVYAAAGDTETARMYFGSAANEEWPLAIENLATYAFDAGRPEEALELLHLATVRMKHELRSAAAPHVPYIRATLAEYANTRAVYLHRLGRSRDAQRSAREARKVDRTMPEAHFNLGVLQLEQAAAQRSRGGGRAGLRRAKRSFARAFALDPAFREAQAMLGVTVSLQGDCASAPAIIREALAPHPGEHRIYPTLTGPGDQNSAALHRRRRIETIRPELEPAARLAACEGAHA